jgi:hypothetical protein
MLGVFLPILQYREFLDIEFALLECGQYFVVLL